METQWPPIAGGEDTAWDFATVTVRHRRYLFFLVSHRPYPGDPINQRLNENLGTFALDLGPDGAVVRTYPERAEIQREHFVNQVSWPGDVLVQMRESEDPFIVVISRDYALFDPRQDPWAIIWLSDYEPETLHKVFSRLARAVRDDEDLFGRLRRHTQSGAFRRLGRKVLGAVEIKPGAFGVALDVNALLDDAVRQPLP